VSVIRARSDGKMKNEHEEVRVPGALNNELALEETTHVEMNWDLPLRDVHRSLGRKRDTRHHAQALRKVEAPVIRKPVKRAYHKRNMSVSKYGLNRKCVACNVVGGTEVHWRRSYDTLKSYYGEDLCDRCGKAESRRLAKEKLRR